MAVHFKASITIWPPDMTKQQQRRLAEQGWYESSEEQLAAAGYAGNWTQAPFGKWGDFWKDCRAQHRCAERR